MKSTVIEDTLTKRPFRPFLIEYSGTPIRVDHPEQALFNNSRTVLVVAAADDHLHLLDVDHIKALTRVPRRRKTSS